VEGNQAVKTLLAIETSCDETSLSVLRDGLPLSLTISSQIEIHRPYGGVVPELASRLHLDVIHPLLDETLQQAGVTLDQLDVIAVTNGPGLAGSLLVGVAVAKILGCLLDIPVLPVNHMEGHLYSVRLEHEVPCPFLSLVCSGGHTQLVWVPHEGFHEILGETRDDAAGEAFDKVAKMVGLPYPGGPVVDRLAKEGNRKAFAFPRPMLNEGFEFSFSGLKTAVRRHWDESGKEVDRLPDLLASFQEAVVDVLATKLIRAARKKGAKHVTVVGGVACNSRLRSVITERAAKQGLKVAFPSPVYCTDNAAMIGRAAWDLRDYLLPLAQQLVDVEVDTEMMRHTELPR
jgi:N6-L-threonylcarbamoyladenine synthase